MEPPNQVGRFDPEQQPDARRGSPRERSLTLEPPQWVWDLIGEHALPEDAPIALGRGALRLVSARIRDARGMSASDLRRATSATYGALRRTISRERSRFPVRFWNMLPHIQESMGAGLDRYMAFNLGRHDAFSDWAGGADELAGVVPTATGVGHHADDLLVYALCAERPAVPVENPRQQPAWRYSERFGPAPPCFARAGRLELADGLVALFVGGTASVRGEDSFAPDDLREQIAETFRNLDAVIGAGLGGDADWLTDGRAYVLAPGDVEEVRRAVTERMPSLERLELCPADICRPELRVEIEGLVVARRGAGGTLLREPHGVAALCAALG